MTTSNPQVPRELAVKIGSNIEMAGRGLGLAIREALSPAGPTGETLVTLVTVQAYLAEAMLELTTALHAEGALDSPLPVADPPSNLVLPSGLLVPRR